MADLKYIQQSLIDQYRKNTIHIPEEEGDEEYCLIRKDTLEYVIEYLHSKLTGTECSTVKE